MYAREVEMLCRGEIPRCLKEVPGKLDTPCLVDVNLKSKSRPRAKINGRFVVVIRYLYEKVYGPLHWKTLILHNCDNGMCVNLSHVRPGTAKDNALDAKIAQLTR